MIGDYGQGKRTEMPLYFFAQIETGFDYNDIRVDKEDRDILRELARKKQEVSQRPEMKEKIKLWTRHNMLEKARPVVLCDPELGWNEVITDRQMKCKGKLARRWEMDFRIEIFWGEEMGDDRVIDSNLIIPYTAKPDDWGLQVQYSQTSTTGSYKWDSPIQDYATDFPNLQLPKVEIDWDTTNAHYNLAQELFSDILEIKLKGTWWWSLGLTWIAVLLRGMENLHMDLIDHPQELRALLAHIAKYKMDRLDYLENNELLSLNNDNTYVCSGGYGFTDELPGDDYNGKTVRCKHMWGFAESQETLNISPKMYEEFIFPYEKPLLDRFGLTGYGCCEPVHGRWETIKKHTNLRRISCSPWVDMKLMAEKLEDKYIFSRKVNPADLAVRAIDTERIRQSIRDDLQVTRDCTVELIMKDNVTIHENPENIVQWCKIAREEADLYG